MRSSFRLAMGLAMLSVLVACEKAGRESEVTTFTPQDSLAVRVESDKWVSTTLARDFDGFATGLTADVIMYPPNDAPKIGREAAMAYIRAYPTITSFTTTIDEITGRGDVAYDRGSYTLTAKLPDGTAINDKGTFVGIFRRQPDGKWAHSRVIWHSDLPLPAPAPATPPRRAR